MDANSTKVIIRKKIYAYAYEFIQKLEGETLFAGKTLLITGGTGSFGNAILRRFLNTDIKQIRIFSRDEKKQDDMRRKYQSEKSNITLVMSGI